MITSLGELVPIPQYYRKFQKHLKTLQKRLSRKKKGSNGWLKVVKLVGKQHKKVANKGQVFILKQPMIYYQKLILLLTKA